MNVRLLTGFRPTGAEGLPETTRHGTIRAADGLDTHRQGWRIRHPQAVTKPRTIHTYPPISGTLPGIVSYLGAWVGSQRKRPHCAFLGLALSCGYPIRLGQFKPRHHPMIFTFVIASSRGRVADMPRIRTISTYATTEAQARASLAGLPLVFISRSPVGGR